LRSIKYILGAIGILILLFLGGIFFLGVYSSRPDFRSTCSIRVRRTSDRQSNKWITLHPTQEEEPIGWIFYPGGRVDPRSYAPLANELARNGNLVVITPMPFNLAIFGANRASQIIEQNPAITHWIIAGHSLGGAMAVNYIDDHPGEVSGLLLLAAYSAARNDISGQILIGASLYGSRDGFVDIQTIYDTQHLLTTSICHS